MRRLGVFTITFKQISHIVLVFHLLNLNKYRLAKYHEDSHLNTSYASYISEDLRLCRKGCAISTDSDRLKNGAAGGNSCSVCLTLTWYLNAFFHLKNKNSKLQNIKTFSKQQDAIIIQLHIYLLRYEYNVHGYCSHVFIVAFEEILPINIF